MLSGAYNQDQGTSMAGSPNPYAPQKKAQVSTLGAQPTQSMSPLNSIFGTQAAKTPTAPAGTSNPSSYYGNSGISGPVDTSGGAYPLLNIYSNLASYLYPLLGQQSQFAGQLEGGREQSIQGLINSLSPSGIQGQIGAFGNAANENAGRSAQYGAAQSQAQGLSPAYQAGNTNAAYNQAASQTNQYGAQLNSPEAQSQRLQQILSAYGQGQSIPILQQLLGISGPTLGEQNLKTHVQEAGGQSSLGGLGGILGSALGGGSLGSLGSIFSSLFGGQGSSGNSSPSGTLGTLTGGAGFGSGFGSGSSGQSF